MTSSQTLRDQMGNCDQKVAARAAMSVVSSLQNFEGTRGAMLSGLCASFLLVSELSGITVPDLLLLSKNAMTDGENWIPEYRAVREFIKHEMLS